MSFLGMDERDDEAHQHWRGLVPRDSDRGAPDFAQEARGGGVAWVLGYTYWFPTSTPDGWDCMFVSLQRTPRYSTMGEAQSALYEWNTTGAVPEPIVA